MERFAILALVAGIATSASAAEPKFHGWQGPKPKTPCECRFRGEKLPLGQQVCQSINGNVVTLQCQLVLNNTTWKKIADGCDVASGETLPFSPMAGQSSLFARAELPAGE